MTRRKDIVVFRLVVYSVNHFLFSSFRSVGDNDRAGYITEPLISFSCLNITPQYSLFGFAPIFPDTCYHLTHYWLAAVDIPVASDNPVHYADAIRYNARTPLQGSLLPLTRLVWA